MALFVGIDVSKDTFDACGIDEGGEKVFSLTSGMDKKGFEKLIAHLKGNHSLLLGLESTACYHLALFSYLTAKGYRVVIINPLLIANFAKLQLRKTKTDKKDALTIAQFLMLRKEALENQTFSADLMELRDLARRRERLTAQGEHEEDTLGDLPRARTPHRGLCRIDPSAPYPLPLCRRVA